VTETRRGPAITSGIFLSPDLCRPLGHALGRVIDLAFGEAGKARVTPDDVILIDFTAQVLAVASGSARNQEDGSVRFREPVPVPLCDQEPVLTVKEAARSSGLSEEFVRRLCREGRAFRARRGRRGAWLIDAAEFAQWAASRREGHDGKAA
jgi:hypothetical protein